MINIITLLDKNSSRVKSPQTQKMSAYNLPNYRERFFEYKDLDKIHGQPTIDSIVKCLRQLKRNAQKVSTTLGG